MSERIDPRLRFKSSVRGGSGEPLGGFSRVDPWALFLAVTAHLVDAEAQRIRAAERLLSAVAEEGGRPRESRFAQLSKREHLNVADLTGRRHGRTYGPSRDGWIRVKWLDTGERVLVRESGLLLRFTVQSRGFVPKSERDQEVVEESEAAWAAQEVEEQG